MMTQELLSDGTWQLNELTENGYIRHVFQTLEELENYVKKCYARGKGEDDGSPSV